MLSARLEHAALLAFAAVLPLFEFPKNLLWLAWLALWLWNRARSGDWGGAWDRWDSAAALLVVSGFAAGGFSAGWDIPKYAAAFLMLKRGRYSDRVLIGLLVALAAGTLAGLAWGYWGVYVTREHAWPGLHSVGHVNHSAIYLTIVFGAALIAARAWWRTSGWPLRLAAAAANAVFIYSIFAMESRAAVIAAFVVAAALLFAYSVRLRHRHWHLAAVFAVVAGLALALKPQVLEKNQWYLERGNFLADRDTVWANGLEVWREHPLLGVGLDRYSQFASAAHGHSLYVNTLVERGALGLTALLVFLALWGWSLARAVPKDVSPPLLWAYWGGAAGAWLVAVIVGLVNTTLHHEHALASMLLLGGWLALRNRG